MGAGSNVRAIYFFMKTIPVSNEGHKVWRRWCKAKKMTSSELMDELIKHVENKKREVFYLSLPHVDKRSKPLEGKKIERIYKSFRVVQ